eukprot:SAG11_NODE_1304_length_5250_cov_5.457581_6_plen_68_part_01
MPPAPHVRPQLAASAPPHPSHPLCEVCAAKECATALAMISGQPMLPEMASRLERQNLVRARKRSSKEP